MSRTSFGIPHVKADNEKGLGYGIGYAFAQDNFCLLADALVTVNGERSKYFGANENYDSTGAGTLQNNLSSDFYFKYLNSPRLVHATWVRQSTEIKDLTQGYAAGVNHYLREVGIEGLPVSCRNRPWVGETSVLDLMRLMRRYAVEGSGNQFIDSLYAAQPPTEASPAAFLATSSSTTVRTQGDTMQSGSFRKGPASRLGSNGVALGRSSTESGAGLLLANPHFPWSTAMRFYQMHLTIPGKVNVMGASLTGFPAINIGFNEDVAWTHTVNTSAHFTLFALQLDPTDPTRYFVDGRTRSMTRKELSVEALGPDGTAATVNGTYYLSEYGPVVQWEGDTAFALSDANFDNDRMFQQWWAMNKAASMAEFKHSIETILGVPWVDTIATDRQGSAYYADVSPVPNVSDAIVEVCVAPQYQPLIADGLFILNGNTSACQWRNDPGAPQKGIFAAAKLPSLLRADFVQNSNDSAWLTNPAQRLTGFPSIVSVDSYEQGGRTRIGLSQISARLSGADGLIGNKFDLESLQSMALSNRSMYAGVLLGDLNAACLGAGVVTLDEGVQVDLAKGCNVIGNWDGTANLESIGWPLFLTWRQFLNESGIDYWNVPFDAADPINTPRGLRLSDATVLAAARASLAFAMVALEDVGVDYTKPWGQIQVAVRGSLRIPIHGGAGDDIYNAIYSAPIGDGQFDVYFGSSALLIVSFEGVSPKARGILTYSQSTDPESPFFVDQTRRFSEKKWIDFPFTDAAIRADSNYSKQVLVED